MGSDPELSPRETAILQVRVANPTASTRQLSAILEGSYGIELSHTRINEILQELVERGVYRATMFPDCSLFHHYLFRIAFHHPNVADALEDAHRFLAQDPHILMFFTADTDYSWQVIAQFHREAQMDRWVRAFVHRHGSVIDRFHTTMLHDIHTFRTDARVFDDILEETETGRNYLDIAARRGNSVGSPMDTD